MLGNIMVQLAVYGYVIGAVLCLAGVAVASTMLLDKFNGGTEK